MKKLYTGLLFVVLSTVFFNSVFALPKEIVIIRHGDKLLQGNPGPTLSAKGQVRAIAFSLYYLNKFGEPDFIFATNPIREEGRDSSIRELQTLAPLANQLAEKHPQNGFPILHPFSGSDYIKLADYILHDHQYDGKKIIICWNHKSIRELVHALGVGQALKKWEDTDFDSVYILQYDSKKLRQYSFLQKQYPLKFSGTWKDLDAAIKKG